MGMVNRRRDGRGTPRQFRTAASPLCLAFSALCGVLAGTIVTLNCVLLRHDEFGTSKASPSVTIQGQRHELQALTLKDKIKLYSEKEASDNSGHERKTGPLHHTIFSTGCSPFQDWQSYVFFYHAWKVQQRGHITRIASGCNAEEATELQRLHKERIDTMSDHFHLHLTPEFKNIKPGKNYMFANKPYGVAHWMDHVLGYPNNTSHDDDIIILLDPDQMLLRPLTFDFSKETNETVIWYEAKAKDMPKLRVEHGKPFAAMYGYADQWLTKTNATNVAGATSPIHNISLNEANDYYPAGPPYLATARDMHNIVLKWTEFLPKVLDVYPHLLAEMFAYSLAAAHMRLPHQLAKSFIVSEVTAYLEGWDLIDPVPAKDVCYSVPQNMLPYTLHYCQQNQLGKWMMQKHKLPKNFLSCESPLLMEPPSDIAVRYNYSIDPGRTEKKYHKKPHFNRREAFMVCTMIRGFNEAAVYFKRHNCPEGVANFIKSLAFHKNMTDE